MGNFLYFPDNKLEYIPSLIIVAIFILGAFLTVKIVMKISKKEEEKALLLEKQLMNPNYNIDNYKQ
ncbi:hypothetical protein ACNQFZ_05035 [Schinkia sp. CFF1]